MSWLPSKNQKTDAFVIVTKPMSKLRRPNPYFSDSDKSLALVTVPRAMSELE